MVAPRLPLPDDQTASPELAAEYAAARRRGGSAMAILRAMGPRAEVVRSFLSITEAVLYGPATLGRRERELLALATSEANGADRARRVRRWPSCESICPMPRLTTRSRSSVS